MRPTLAFSVAILMVIAITAAVLAQSSESLTNDDIVKMVRAELSTTIIVTTVESAKSANFDLSPSALVTLKGAGVNDRIIETMQMKARDRAQSSGRNAGSPAQGLDDAAVLAAIAAGEAGEVDRLVSYCKAGEPFFQGLGQAVSGNWEKTSPFHVITATNAGRIAYMAEERKRRYKPLTLDAIPASLRSLTKLYVLVAPEALEFSLQWHGLVLPIQHVVLKSRRVPGAIVQAERVEGRMLEWDTLMDADTSGSLTLATFDINAVKALPEGEINVVLVTSRGERQCKIGTKDRVELLK